MTVFAMLGSTQAMYEWAEKNQTVFYTQILSRLMPAPQRDDPDVQVNQVNISHLTNLEAATRIAFALRLGMQAKQELEERREDLL
ncbi:hypothetical protein ABGT18_09825 [Pseudomonas putida]|uniref:Uncharacterized protein n=1 Tax=Pseudomonas plecoglossicida TaxID=70775 RepID=A0AAD0QZ91_PSEDL|nr:MULTISPECIES: hypothetical protein [Pseudomonas putida group]AXM97702.1 hypothetical protein DVB73_18860 [Pseudomonas plecoglossicida]EPB95716.1 hypothetical protein L321_11635 [Pseudomonas plecoglossicida NB2011]MDM9599233.1 hypothetical protein [Pseudomonas shirazica]MDO2412661.1 hypothetical protein [Pseudomonas shirazica]QLB57528.1 hypothetical protein HAV28_23310 [Pseudomonas plecoglossicida]